MTILVSIFEGRLLPDLKIKIFSLWSFNNQHSVVRTLISLILATITNISVQYHLNWIVYFSVDKTCRNLTETDAPSNGGLVCHWYREENSQQCSVKCNPGYDFPSRINNYEMCGPTTGFLWSHEEREEPIEPCIGKFCAKVGKWTTIWNIYNLCKLDLGIDIEMI